MKKRESECRPLYGTARSARPTLGPLVAEVAAKLGKPLMPHQREIVDIAFEIDPATGLLAYHEVVVIGPRQVTGKTELLLPVMTYRCTEFDRELANWSNREFGHEVPIPGPQSVLYMAQGSEESRKKWRNVHVTRLRASSYVGMFSERLQAGREMLTWANGSTWEPASATPKTSGTGGTTDMPVLDEAWAQPDFRTEIGLRPTMMTRPWRQMWIASMIPGLSRAQPGTWAYLAQKRQVGRARVAADVRHGVAFFDFSAAPGLDPGDPDTWWSCMPGLGITVDERTVAADFEALDLADFEAEYLGWAPDAEKRQHWTLVSRAVWANLWDQDSMIIDRPALAVEFNEERTRAWVGASGRRADGHFHVELVEPGGLVPLGTSGVEWAERRIVDIYRANKACCVVIDPRRPANSLIVALKNAGIDVLTPNQNEIAGACGRFYDRTGQQPSDDDDGLRLFHLGDPVLDRALESARKLEMGPGSFTFVRKGSGDTIAPLYVVTLAMHGADVKGGQRVPEAEIFF